MFVISLLLPHFHWTYIFSLQKVSCSFHVPPPPRDVIWLPIWFLPYHIFSLVYISGCCYREHALEGCYTHTMDRRQRRGMPRKMRISVQHTRLYHALGHYHARQTEKAEEGASAKATGYATCQERDRDAIACRFSDKTRCQRRLPLNRSIRDALLLFHAIDLPLLRPCHFPSMLLHIELMDKRT